MQSKADSDTDSDSDQEDDKDAFAFLPEIIWRPYSPAVSGRTQLHPLTVSSSTKKCQDGEETKIYYN